ncbi:hypothetical protein AB0910_12995 [Streptomyces sp. NPDC047002]|uniref:hypothetical protein n=1 Tax=Streptomyces sp. NPDC047002 TaxID=3155475 RepID=UPI003454B4FF
MRRITGAGALAAAGTAVAALLLAGCGGGGSHDTSASRAPSAGTASGGAGAPAASASAHPPSPAPGSGPGSQTVAQVAAGLAGTWQGETDGSVVTLAVKGVQAVVIADGHVCQGTIQEMGVPMLAMTCTDGDRNRVMGIVSSNDGRTAVIAWGDTKRDILKKTAGVPSGLPSLPAGALPSAGAPTPGA